MLMKRERQNPKEKAKRRKTQDKFRVLQIIQRKKRVHIQKA
jgi:hypothetical protein